MLGQRDRSIEQQIPSLRRYARALLRDADRADDLVQDCLVRALDRWHLWRRNDNLRAWLFTIMHNLHVNAQRRQGRAPRQVSWNDDDGHGVSQPAQEQRLLVNDLAKALEDLPEEQKQVALLVGLEGFSYRAAAKIIGVPVGTVMSRLARGREKLRLALSGDGGPALRRIK